MPMGTRFLIAAAFTWLGTSTPVAPRDNAGVMDDGSDLVPRLEAALAGLAIMAPR